MDPGSKLLSVHRMLNTTRQCNSTSFFGAIAACLLPVHAPFDCFFFSYLRTWGGEDSRKRQLSGLLPTSLPTEKMRPDLFSWLFAASIYGMVRRPCSGTRRCCLWLSRRGGRCRISPDGALHQIELPAALRGKLPHGEHDLVEGFKARVGGGGNHGSEAQSPLQSGFSASDHTHILSST